MRLHPYLLSIFALGLFLLPLGTKAQNIQTEFGKNRVQYHNFVWFEYESQNFRVYWYGDGRGIAESVVQIAEWDYTDIKVLLEHRINRKIEILVYTDLTDLKQSNIGNEDTFINTGGTTKIVENKIFVYFNGNHRDLRRQIREGVAEVYINTMLFGTNFQEVVQNAVLLNLPEWFTKGLVGYSGEPWSTDLDNQLRDIFVSGKYKDFEEFAENEPKLAGHSLWYYVDNNYGKSTVSNLLYLTRINRSVESGFLYVVGTPYYRMLSNWEDYFNKRYGVDAPEMKLPSESTKIEVKNKHNLPIQNATISPDGKSIAYSTNELGKQKVYIQDLSTGEREMVFKTGSCNRLQATDYEYPLLAWNTDNTHLGIMYERRDVVKLLQINRETKEEIEQEFAPQYQRVHSMEFISPNQMVITGTVRGFSDVFLYSINTRGTTRITTDFWDDLDATYVKLDDVPGIMWVSNRGADSVAIQNKLDSIIPFETYDIYYYALEGNDAKEIVRITDTPLANERSPYAINNENYGFVSDVNGVQNRYTGELEEFIAYYEKVVKLKDGGEELIYPKDSVPALTEEQIDTMYLRPVVKRRGSNFAASDYNRNIVELQANSRSGKYVETIFHDDSYSLYVSSNDASLRTTPLNTEYRQQLLKRSIEEPTIIPDEKDDRPKRPKDNTPEPNEKSDWEFEPDWGLNETPKEPEDKPSPKAPSGKEDPGFTFITDHLEEYDTDTPPKEDPIVPETPVTAEQDTDIIDVDNYQFESDFEPELPDNAAVIVQEEDGNISLQSPSIAFAKDPVTRPKRKVHRFYPPRILPHRRKFKANTITTQLDNGYLFEGLDNYTGDLFELFREAVGPGIAGTVLAPLFDNPYQQPPPGIFLKGSIQDLFEDYELEGGIRLPTTFDGLEYYVTFKDMKKRLDKHYTYYRKARTQTFDLSVLPNPYNVKTVSDMVQTDLRYPLDIFSSIRARAAVRLDKTQFQANDRITLDFDPIRTQRINLRLEYVYDNTIDVSTNIKNGTRAKVYVEGSKSMDVSLLDGLNFNFNKGFMGIVGFDARHYIRVGKHSVLAARAAGASSFGSEKILFYLGGTNNWLFPSFNTTIPTPDPLTTNFAYQTVAAPLRGFRANIRNGNSYALGNLEFRVPIFKYFYKRQIRSSFVRNFQFVAFADVGTAWRGASPFSEDNPLNTDVITTPPGVISVTVNYFRDPIVLGFGGGVRTKLFGYFLRLDYARGIETKILQPGVWYLSMGTDF